MPSVGLLLILLAPATPADLGRVPDNAVRVYLIRHAEAYLNLEPPPAAMTPEQMDALTEEGRLQAESVGKALKGQPLAVVLHSPPRRTRETAEILVGARSLPVRPEPRLRRIDYGTTEAGKPLELSDRARMWEIGRDIAPKDGESLVGVGQRMVGLIDSLRTSHAGSAVAAVTHAEVIAALLGHLDGTPGAQRHPPRVPIASITVIEMNERKEIRALLVKFQAQP